MPPNDLKPSIEQTPTATRRICFAFATIGLILFLALRLEALAVSACLLYGFLWSSGVLARRSAAGLRVSIETPGQRVHAGERIEIQLTLTNLNRFLPVYSPCLRIQAAGRARPQSFHYPAFIRPRQTVSIPAHPVVARRGRQSLTLLGWTLLFPFALHETRARCRVQSGDFIVWPAKVRIDTRALLPSTRERIEHRSQGAKPRPDRSDPTSYREYNRGDSRRAINWKLSAKVNRLMVAESQPGAPRRISLILELSDTLWTSRPRFERMLSMTTAAAIALHRQGRLEAVYIDGYRFSQGQRADLNRLLDALALCELRRPRPMEIPERVLSAALRIVPSASHGIALVPALNRQTARVRAAAGAPHRL